MSIGGMKYRAENSFRMKQEKTLKLVTQTSDRDENWSIEIPMSLSL